MNTEIRELYQQVILDHNKNPRNFREMEDADSVAEGYNPLCGDHINVYLKLENDKVKEVSFHGSGCAISKASASVMTTILKDKTKEEAEEIFHKFQELVTGKAGDEPDLEQYGKLAIFAGVRDFPARVKCASLAWHTVQSALKDKGKPVVSTE